MATAANVVKLKRSAVAGRIPSTTDLALGELALNTYDGRIYLKKSVSAVESIVVLQQHTGGSGITVNSDGVISTVQDIATTASPTFANATISTNLNVKGSVTLGTASSGTGYFYTLPNIDGTNGQVLTTNGTGQVVWSTVAGGGGGSAYSVNYTSQSLTTNQKTQARTNIDAIDFDDAILISMIMG
jgi:hypothetical protein